MKFSIIIPCYNNSRYLPQCLDSAIRNIKDDDKGEIICVDDCSTDGIVEVLERYAKECRFLKIIRHEVNRGSNEARRSGVLAATGDYVLFADPDDMLVEGVLDALSSRLSKNEVDALFFGFEYINAHSIDFLAAETPKARYLRRIYNGHLLATSKKAALDSIFSLSPRLAVMVWGRAWKRDLVTRAFELIPEGWCVEQEDDCEILMFLALAESVSMIDYTGYRYRIDSGVTSDALDEKTTVRYLRNGVFIERFISAFGRYFGEGHPYCSYLTWISNNLQRRYLTATKYLARMDKGALLDSERTDQMWMVYGCNIAAIRLREFRVLETLPFVHFTINMRRIWLKVRIMFSAREDVRCKLMRERQDLKRLKGVMRHS